MTVARARLRPFPLVALAAAAGVLLIAGAHALSRTGGSGGTALFWLGVGLIVIPASLMITGSRATRNERAATVVLVGLGLYAAKVLRDPFMFTFGDELAHLTNLQQISETGRLFGSNSLLPITPQYPGLEALTQGIASTGACSPFAAGIAVIAAARALFMLTVFLIYERLTGSSRLAGVGALITTAAPTFLFFSAQFSYESLAIPLGVLGIFTVVRRQTAVDAQERRAWGTVLVLTAAGLIATHHLTAYVFLAFLVLACLLVSALERPRNAPWVETGIVASLIAAMLVLVASQTVGYLSPPVVDALNGVLDTLKREDVPRQLFTAGGGAPQTSAAERIVAVGALGLLALLVLTGLRTRWPTWRRSPVLVILALAAVGYLVIQPLRLVPAAWETANRSGSALYLGVGIAAATGLMWWFERRPPRPWRHAVVALSTTLLIAGGVIAGWPADLRLGQPFRVKDGAQTREPPAAVAAQWARAELDPGTRMAAQNADARLMVVLGRQTAFQGSNPNYEDLLAAPTLEPWQRALLRDNRIALLVTDRRPASTDNISGYFFDRRAPVLAPLATAGKFNLPSVDRLYDDGTLVIFDVRGLR